VSVPPGGGRPADAGAADGLTGALLEHLHAGVVAADRGGRVTFANRSALATLQLDPQACLGRPLAELFGSHRPPRRKRRAPREVEGTRARLLLEAVP